MRILLLVLLCSSLALASPVLDGAFFQLSSRWMGHGPGWWEEQLDRLEEAGMTILLMQSSLDGGGKYYDNAKVVGYRFPGPFAPGTYTLTLAETPVVLTEIETSVPFSYQITSPEPGGLFADDGWKLRNGILDEIFYAVGWSHETPGPVQIEIGLEVETDQITIYTYIQPSRKPLAPSQIVLNGHLPVESFRIGDDFTYLLEEAQKRGMQVWLGLHFDGAWWSGSMPTKPEIEKNLLVARDLEELYGDYESFYGWYIPHEFRPCWLPESYFEFFKELTQELKATGRPVAIAPFFRVEYPLQSHTRFWERFFREIPIDVLMLQDGVGEDRSRIQSILPHYQAISEVAHRHGVEFWSVLEVFHVEDREAQTPAIPAPMEKVREQLITQSPWADRIVIFDWPHYMAPSLNPSASQLYYGYLEYLKDL